MTNVRRVMHMAAVLIMAVIAAPLGAQAAPDSVFRFPPAFGVYMQAQPDTVVRAFCVVTYSRYRGALTVDSLVVAPTATNPTCPPRQAVLLVRPLCAFTISEFLHLRYRAVYVAIWGRANGCVQGLPLRDWPQADDITSAQVGQP